MIAILGANGMLGRFFVKFYGKEAIPVTRKDCDFSNIKQLIRHLDSKNFSTLINCAANIDINYIEQHHEDTFYINCILPNKIATYCKERSIKFVHISTDHYYKDKILKHTEKHPITLLNKYAEQKFIAENLIFYSNSNSLIARTSIIGTKNFDGKTFLEWIIKTIKEEKIIHGFIDAYTSSIDSNFLCYLIDKSLSKKLSGVYNYGSNEPYTKYNLIKYIIKILELDCDITLKKQSVNTLKVDRANNCGLNCDKLVNSLGIEMPKMQDVIENINVREIYEKI